MSRAFNHQHGYYYVVFFGMNGKWQGCRDYKIADLWRAGFNVRFNPLVLSMEVIYVSLSKQEFKDKKIWWGNLEVKAEVFWDKQHLGMREFISVVYDPNDVFNVVEKYQLVMENNLINEIN